MDGRGEAGESVELWLSNSVGPIAHRYLCAYIYPPPKQAKDIPHKTTVGPKMETVGHPRTQEKAPAAPTATTAAKPPAPSTGTGKGREVEEEGEEEMFMPQTPSTTPAMAVAAAADTAQGATNAPLASDLYRVGPAGGTGKPPSQKEAAEELAHVSQRLLWLAWL